MKMPYLHFIDIHTRGGAVVEAGDEKAVQECWTTRQPSQWQNKWHLSVHLRTVTEIDKHPWHAFHSFLLLCSTASTSYALQFYEVNPR